MVHLTYEEILKVTGGKPAGDGKCNEITGISTDSRTIEKGSLFIPLKGENFDGHDFIGSAFEKGAVLALTEKREVDFPGKPLIIVENTLKALQDLAAYYRDKFPIPFVGVTGSVGKTSTKEMVAKVLGRKFNVLKNEGNLNNEIGVPLTVFRLDKVHEAAVVEMGMSGFGEISTLSHIVKPKVGIITNIGISHIEKLGSRQNILKAKLEILDGMPPDGLLILNGDDVMLSGAKGLLTHRTVSYGLEEGADYMAYNINSFGEEGISFDVTVDGRDYTVHIPTPGVHNVYNALAAVAAGHELGVPMEDIIEGIAIFSPEKMRLNIINANGIKVLNDAYNASPQSVKAALSVLEEIEGSRKIAVLGDMLELGEWSQSSHTEIGRFAADLHLDYIVTVGPEAVNIVKGATESGFSSERAVSFENNADALNYLLGILQKGDVVLVKGSRGMKMEEIVNSLTAEG